jgi:D-xylose transport system substrate-binding protein
MKVSKFMTTLLMAAVLAVTMVAACGASGQKEGKPGKKLLIGKIPITLAASVHQADVKWEAQYLKDKYGGEYTYIDGKGDATVTNTAMEDLRAKNVTGIIINPTDPAAINESVREARKAGIPVITYYMTPTMKP